MGSSPGLVALYSICSKMAKRSRTSSSSSIEAAPAILMYRFSHDTLRTDSIFPLYLQLGLLFERCDIQ
jgi:hypothetical protein